MTKRVEAAARVLMLQSEGVELNDGYLTDAAEVLAAADAVMFSDEAIERAALALSFRMEDITRAEAIGDVRAVIEQLKGSGDE